MSWNGDPDSGRFVEPCSHPWFKDGECTKCGMSYTAVQAERQNPKPRGYGDATA